MVNSASNDHGGLRLEDSRVNVDKGADNLGGWLLALLDGQHALMLQTPSGV